MQLNFLHLGSKENLIDGTAMHRLKINRDKRGMLMETLKEDWADVFKRPELQFGQSYYSITLPGYARDEDQWHVHPTKQVDRFIVIKGNAVVALFDWRKDSPTYGVLNLFRLGEANGDEGQYLLLIPKNVLHAFCTVGKNPCFLISFPSHIYDSSEEGRVPFKDAGVVFSDNTPFSWDAIRQSFES